MGLVQFSLLRSQHKMARLLLVGLVALCVASTKAAVIPVEEIVDGLQSFLTAPEESGLRLKRSTGEWDEEFDLSSMGILFQLKYTNPANPFEGGRAHVKVPGARFVRNALSMTWKWTSSSTVAQMINKMKIEEHNILDGKTWYHIKYDNTAPRTAFLFTFLPYNMDRAWTYEGGREHTANGGFTMTHKITHGENVIQEGEMVFDVKANDGSKFEMEHLHKMTMTEESPFYGMVFWWTGRYGKNVERKMTFVFDKINKSFLFVPKMSMNTIDLAWPKMTTDASDLEFGVTITPNRKVVTKFGWEWAGVNKVYLDVVGNNPWIGDYKMSRQGEFELVSGSVYKIKWTGHGETAKGFLHRVSPVETHVVTIVNMKNMKVDAIVWKSFAGKKYGFTLTNDKFNLLAGQH